MYGIAVGRGGMACCPFHDDRHPSMKLNEDYFYCFGCGATGDVIDFTARLYDLSSKEAAEKLALDFWASPMTARPRPGEVMSGKNPRRRRGKKKREHAWRVLTGLLPLAPKMGKPIIPPKRRTRTRIPVLWRLFKRKINMGYLLDTFLDSSTGGTGPVDRRTHR